MELNKFFQALRQSLVLVLACSALGALLGLGIALATPKSYAAKTETFFTVARGDLTQATAFSTGMLKSYAMAAQSDLVLEPAAKQLGMSTADLDKKIAVVIPAGTTIVEVTANDGDPQRAADVANAVTQALQKATATLSPEQVITSTTSTNTETTPKAVRSQILSAAVPPTTAASPHPGLNAALGLVAGLLVGILAALARAARRVAVNDGPRRTSR